MDILILGYSKIVRKRVLPALEKIAEIKSIEIATYTQVVGVNGKINKTYTDYDEALQTSTAKLVYISTVNSDHKKWIIAALENNFNVMVDKPAVLEIDDARFVTSLATQKQLFLSEAIVYKYHPQIKAIKELFELHNDRPKRITANFSVPGFEDSNFRYDANKGGGAIFDMGAYALTIGELFFDSAYTSINAFKISDTASKNIDQGFSVIIKYADDQTLIGHFGFDTEYVNQCFILGNTLSVNFDRIFTIDADTKNKINYNHKNKGHLLEAPAGDSFELYVLDCLKNISEFNNSTHTNNLLKQAESIYNLQTITK